MSVGFLGLGSMGSAMARNLLQAGNTVTVWNRDSEKAKPLGDEGATIAATPLDVAGCDVVFAMLANDAATRSVLIESGLLQKLGSSTILVNCATISLALSRELTAAFLETKIAYVAAPVLGRPEAAAAAKLNIIAAGDPAAIERIAPLLSQIGQQTFRLGADPPLANVAKIGANFLIASAIESMSEAFALCASNGLEPRELYDVVTNTLFSAPVYKNYGAQILEERFEPAGFALELGRKDVGLAEEAASSGSVTLPFVDALARVFLSAIEAGDGQKDWSAISLQTRQGSS